MKTIFIFALLSNLASSILSLNSVIGGTLQPSIYTVNSDSILEIYSLTSSIYSTFNAGDCFQIELDLVDQYEDISPGFYEPFPYITLEDCSFSPAAECSRVSGQTVQIKLTESGNNVVGTIGKMKNPFSVVALGVQKIKYFSGCASTTQDDMSSSISDMNFAPG